MKWRQVFTVYRKELRDSLRDRRTLFSMIAFPALIMPAMMIGGFVFSMKAVRSAQAELPTVMLIGGENGVALAEALTQSTKLKVIPATKDYAQKISEKSIRAAVEIPAGFDTAIAQSEASAIKIYNYEGEMRSGFASGVIERIVDEYRESVVRGKLTQLHLPNALVRPFELQRSNVAPPEKIGGNTLGGIIPYFFIFLSFIGAMYPAIDLTAGEKERGTMETILCSPVGRVELVLGKFLTVLTASLTTMLVSITSLGVSAMVILSMIHSGGARASAAASSGLILNPMGLLAVVVMVIPLAVLFSAAVFAIALFAKSHKEAQTYVSPLMIAIVMPSVAAMMPGVELSPKLALIPIMNVSLVSKEMLTGSFPFGSMALIFLSSCVYAAIALAVAVHLFKRESVIFRT